MFFSRRCESERCCRYAPTNIHVAELRLREKMRKTKDKCEKRGEVRKDFLAIARHRENEYSPTLVRRRSFPSSAVVSISAERFTALHPRTPCPAAGKSPRDTGNSLPIELNPGRLTMARTRDAYVRHCGPYVIDLTFIRVRTRMDL